MQDKVIVPLQGWNCSDICEQTLTSQNCIQEEIKSRLKKPGIACGTESFVFHSTIKKFKD